MNYPLKNFAASRHTWMTLMGLLLMTPILKGNTLHIGASYAYHTLAEAAAVAEPGDTLLVHEGTYAGNEYVAQLQGTSVAKIYILAAPGETVIYSGGGNAWQFSDGAYLHIAGFIFEHQTGNGLNFDDGGTYDSPAHHIVFEHCIFRDMDASGNNDLLKLSGLDSFEVRSCAFLNGAAGGSGIDMVGCHDGLITGSRFENLGSNSIQTKGGSRNIRIEKNVFMHGGDRALNLGGSTGLPYFRPLNAPYEAADLKVYANVFIGSTAPVAFVGAIQSEVINNTFYLPEKWVLRILQETVDPDRFPPCGQNTFSNNIIWLDHQVSVECNIGPNTAPETFTISNNLWYHAEDGSWPGPDLPVNDVNQIIGQDPLFTDPTEEMFSLSPGSPAIGKGLNVLQPETDFDEHPFLMPRSIGAFEGGMMTSSPGIVPAEAAFMLYPNPASGEVFLEFNSALPEKAEVTFITLEGKTVARYRLEEGQQQPFVLPVWDLASGCYVVNIHRLPSALLMITEKQ